MLLPFREYRFAPTGLVFATLLALSACGGSQDDSAFASSADASVAATDASEASTVDAVLKAATTKLPVPRVGSESPVDSAPDKAANPDTTPPATTLDPSTLLLTGFETGITLSEASGAQRGDRTLAGQDTGGTALPVAFAGATVHDGNIVRARVGDAGITDVSPWLGAQLRSLTGADSQPSRALVLSSLADSGADQSIALEYGGLTTEMPLYQRMRVKFDIDLLDRARSLGSDHFFLTVWQAESQDRRFRVKLTYRSPYGLVWQMKSEALDDPHHGLWTQDLTSVAVPLAGDDSPLGWQTVEIWLDRQGGHFRVAIDGQTIGDKTDRLIGPQGTPIHTLRPAMVAHTPVASVRFDALQVRNSVPTDAWGGAASSQAASE